MGRVKEFFHLKKPNYGDFQTFWVGKKQIHLLKLFEPKNEVIFHPVLAKILACDLPVVWLSSSFELEQDFTAFCEEDEDDYWIIID
jgi:hypothetical protein